MKLDASFANDFKFGRFQYTCLETSIGAYFNVKLGEQDHSRLKTIGDAISLIRKKLESK